MFSSLTVDYGHKSISVLQKNTSEFLQALKIPLLQDVLVSKAPAGTAMAAGEHSQDLSLWRAPIHFALLWHHWAMQPEAT